MEKSYKQLLPEITTLIFDVDGVFTDNKIYLINSGEMARTSNVRDGYAVQLAIKKGLRIAIITGGRSVLVKERFEMLGVKDVFIGVADKIKVLNEYCNKHSIKKSEILYMGDDIPDYEVMKEVGVAACPQDAVPEIKSVSNYISHIKGGDGCVRDVIEQVMKVKNIWL
jgi:3-deoxy-D-manno-octulosonate 8-phosphate phosphatase (KDO 8-P phosphatase)